MNRRNPSPRKSAGGSKPRGGSRTGSRPSAASAGKRGRDDDFGGGERKRSFGSPRSSDKPFGEKRPYAKKEGGRSFDDKPKRSYGGDRDSRSFDEKPKRRSSGDKPFSGRGSRDERSFGDKPKRSFGGDRESRSFDDKPKRSFGGDRDSRSFDDKPKRSYGGDRDSRSFDDKPKRRSSGDKPFSGRGSRDERSFDDKPKRSYGGDRDSRSFDDKPKRRSSDDRPFSSRGSRDESSFEDKPKRSYDSDRSDRSSDRPSFNKERSGTGARGGYEKKRTPRGHSDWKDINKRVAESKERRYGKPEPDYVDEEFSAPKRSTAKTGGKRPGTRPRSLSNLTRSGSGEGLRLNKFLANAGICSRREADDFITAGLVSVNGKVVTEMGFKISPTDLVTYNGERVRRERSVYILLNKPKDYITTTDDPQERKTVMNLVSGVEERIYPVGRLDRNTTGILLLTNDGDLTKKLTHPKFEVKKLYHVFLDKPFQKQHFEQMEKGLTLEDGFIKPDDLSYVSGAKSKAEVGIEIHSGKNRIVRRMFEHLGYRVDRLDRVLFGGLNKKDLPRGRWRHLTPEEVALLKSLR